MKKHTTHTNHSPHRKRNGFRQVAASLALTLKRKPVSGRGGIRPRHWRL